jgi:hypothetical protein
MIRALVILAALAPLPAAAFSAGCDLKPAWLCYVGSTWWKGSTEAETRAYVLAHCHDEPAAVVCREGSRTVRIAKGPAK